VALITVTTNTAPATPSSGSATLYVDSTTKLLNIVNDAGVSQTAPLWKFNQSVAAQGPAFSADTYLVGSAISIPSGYPRVGTLYRASFDVSKTAAGTATPIIVLRIGTLGTTADAAICTFTFSAGTAAADLGIVSVWGLFRTVGSGTSAVVQGRAEIRHGLSATTGLISLVSQTLQVTSGGFDSTIANTIIGLSVNGGASAAWTVQLVESELRAV
jgi:hypothetical protein